MKIKTLLISSLVFWLAFESLASVIKSFSALPSSSDNQIAQTVHRPQTQYPKTAKIFQTDNYFGTIVDDPYRWLENENSPQTAQWVEQQNQLTFGYLENIPYRQQLKARLQKINNYQKYFGPLENNYPKYSAPLKKGDNYFFSLNSGLQNQSVLYIQKGLEAEAEILLDPNQFSNDGTANLSSFAPSQTGKYAVYGILSGGSDWEEYRVMEVATKKTFSEVLKWVKISNIAWHGDGFYYSRYDAPKPGQELTEKNEEHKVYYHRIGTPQSEDQLVYENPKQPERFHIVQTTEDEKFLILSIYEPGKGKRGNALYYRDLSLGNTDFTPIVNVIGDEQYSVVDNVGERLLLWTDLEAPNGRVVLYDPKNPTPHSFSEVLPERREAIESITLAGGKLFATYLVDVATKVYVFSLDGQLEREIKLPGLGTAVGFEGEKEDPFVFYTFSSFTSPETIYRYDINHGSSSIFATPKVPFNPNDYQTSQVFYHSSDGTRIPMFIVHQKGMKRNGNNPTLLTAYGGFGISFSPKFDPLRIALLEQGMVLAVANIRGGGEYGQKWHDAARNLNRHKAFADFIAAAEYLITGNYTNSERLAITGRSNGGLLMGVALNQRPDLFCLALVDAGVLDLLRFQKFTIGYNWIAEYGSSDNETDFRNLYSYSPLHNIRSGVDYPAILITTADKDDRVVPAHSFKYAATLQEKAAGSNPILIRIDTQSGHGASSTTKRIEQTADMYAFLFHNLGVTPKWPEQ